jgi:hypothetical protein
LENWLKRLLILARDASKTGMTLPSGYISTHRRHRSFNGCGLHISSGVVDDIPLPLSKLHFTTSASVLSLVRDDEEEVDWNP